jgi:hypothetical protein
MDNETKTLFLSIAVALGLLWLLKPKGTNIIGKEQHKDADRNDSNNSNNSNNSNKSNDKYAEPKIASESTKKEKDNAVIALQAMREAIKNKEPKRELDKLNAMISQDYGVKVLLNKKTLKLRAMSKQGKVLAEEN